MKPSLLSTSPLPSPIQVFGKCSKRLHSDKIWSGYLCAVSCRDSCKIGLVYPVSGDVFAATSFLLGHCNAAVETILDASRYIVLCIEDGHGKHTFLCLSFGKRNEAFDFNVALSDHEKYFKREHDLDCGSADRDDDHTDIHPAVNHPLKVPYLSNSYSSK